LKGDVGAGGPQGAKGEKGETGPAGEVSADILNNLVRLTLPDTSRQATASASITSGFVTSAQITDGGLMYSGAPAVSILDPTGSGAVLEALVVNGSIAAIIIKSTGAGYSNPKITIEKPNSSPSQKILANTIFSGNNSFNGKFTGDGNGLTNIPNLWRRVLVTNNIAHVSYSLNEKTKTVLINENENAKVSLLTTPDNYMWPTWKILVEQMYWPGKIVGIVIKYRMGGTARTESQNNPLPYPQDCCARADTMSSSATIEVFGGNIITNHYYDVGFGAKASAPPGIDSTELYWPLKQYVLQAPVLISDEDRLKPIVISYLFWCSSDYRDGSRKTKNPDAGGVLESIQIISEKNEYTGN
jgi:hypothetical protein